jgi:hypothetical protein
VGRGQQVVDVLRASQHVLCVVRVV